MPKTQAVNRRTAKGAVSAVVLSFAAFGVHAQDATTLRMGLIFGPQAPIVQCGAMPLTEDEALRGVGINIQVVHSAQLGGENDMVQQVSSGQLEITGGTASILAAYLEDLSVLEAYYLYENVDQVLRVHQTETARGLFEQLREIANMRQIGAPWLYGERHIFGNRALRTAEDFAGLRLRVPETTVSIESARALGASPTPTAYAELYLALQQGIVDAAEAPASIVYAESFYEPAQYFNKTGHLITAFPVVINEQVWQRLSAEQQEALDVAFTEAADRVRDCVEEADAAAYAAWEADGSIEIIEDIDFAALRERAEAHFSEGFSWSETYRQLLSDLREE
jgi:TRAP-type transport system periplasmic protein